MASLYNAAAGAKAAGEFERTDGGNKMNALDTTFNTSDKASRSLVDDAFKENTLASMAGLYNAAAGAKAAMDFKMSADKKSMEALDTTFDVSDKVSQSLVNKAKETNTLASMAGLYNVAAGAKAAMDFKMSADGKSLKALDVNFKLDNDDQKFVSDAMEKNTLASMASLHNTAAGAKAAMEFKLSPDKQTLTALDMNFKLDVADQKFVSEAMDKNTLGNLSKLFSTASAAKTAASFTLSADKKTLSALGSDFKLSALDQQSVTKALGDKTLGGLSKLYNAASAAKAALDFTLGSDGKTLNALGAKFNLSDAGQKLVSDAFEKGTISSLASLYNVAVGAKSAQAFEISADGKTLKALDTTFKLDEKDNVSIAKVLSDQSLISLFGLFNSAVGAKAAQKFTLSDDGKTLNALDTKFSLSDNDQKMVTESLDVATFGKLSSLYGAASAAKTAMEFKMEGAILHALDTTIPLGEKDAQKAQATIKELTLGKLATLYGTANAAKQAITSLTEAGLTRISDTSTGQIKFANKTDEKLTIPDFNLRIDKGKELLFNPMTKEFDFTINGDGIHSWIAFSDGEIATGAEGDIVKFKSDVPAIAIVVSGGKQSYELPVGFKTDLETGRKYIEGDFGTIGNAKITEIALHKDGSLRISAESSASETFRIATPEGAAHEGVSFATDSARTNYTIKTDKGAYKDIFGKMEFAFAGNSFQALHNSKGATITNDSGQTITVKAFAADYGLGNGKTITLEQYGNHLVVIAYGETLKEGKVFQRSQKIKGDGSIQYGWDNITATKSMEKKDPQNTHLVLDDLVTAAESAKKQATSTERKSYGTSGRINAEFASAIGMLKEAQRVVASDPVRATKLALQALSNTIEPYQAATQLNVNMQKVFDLPEGAELREFMASEFGLTTVGIRPYSIAQLKDAIMSNEGFSKFAQSFNLIFSLSKDLSGKEWNALKNRLGATEARKEFGIGGDISRVSIAIAMYQGGPDGILTRYVQASIAAKEYIKDVKDQKGIYEKLSIQTTQRLLDRSSERVGTDKTSFTAAKTDFVALADQMVTDSYVGYFVNTINRATDLTAAYAAVSEKAGIKALRNGTAGTIFGSGWEKVSYWTWRTIRLGSEPTSFSQLKWDFALAAITIATCGAASGAGAFAALAREALKAGVVWGSVYMATHIAVTLTQIAFTEKTFQETFGTKKGLTEFYGGLADSFRTGFASGMLFAVGGHALSALAKGTRFAQFVNFAMTTKRGFVIANAAFGAGLGLTRNIVNSWITGESFSWKNAGMDMLVGAAVGTVVGLLGLGLGFRPVPGANIGVAGAISNNAVASAVLSYGGTALMGTVISVVSGKVSAMMEGRTYTMAEAKKDAAVGAIIGLSARFLMGKKQAIVKTPLGAGAAGQPTGVLLTRVTVTRIGFIAKHVSAGVKASTLIGGMIAANVLKDFASGNINIKEAGWGRNLAVSVIQGAVWGALMTYALGAAGRMHGKGIVKQVAALVGQDAQTGKVAHIWSASLKGAIKWITVSPMFTILQSIYHTALLSAKEGQFTGFVTRTADGGYANLTVEMIVMSIASAPRTGLWMGPVMGLFAKAMVTENLYGLNMEGGLTNRLFGWIKPAGVSIRKLGNWIAGKLTNSNSRILRGVAKILNKQFFSKDAIDNSRVKIRNSVLKRQVKSAKFQQGLEGRSPTVQMMKTLGHSLNITSINQSAWTAFLVTAVSETLSLMGRDAIAGKTAGFGKFETHILGWVALFMIPHFRSNTIGQVAQLMAQAEVEKSVVRGTMSREVRAFRRELKKMKNATSQEKTEFLEKIMNAQENTPITIGRTTVNVNKGFKNLVRELYSAHLLKNGQDFVEAEVRNAKDGSSTHKITIREVEYTSKQLGKFGRDVKMYLSSLENDTSLLKGIQYDTLDQKKNARERENQAVEYLHSQGVKDTVLARVIVALAVTRVLYLQDGKGEFVVKAKQVMYAYDVAKFIYARGTGQTLQGTAYRLAAGGGKEDGNLMAIKAASDALISAGKDAPKILLITSQEKLVSNFEANPLVKAIGNGNIINPGQANKGFGVNVIRGDSLSGEGLSERGVYIMSANTLKTLYLNNSPILKNLTCGVIDELEQVLQIVPTVLAEGLDTVIISNAEKTVLKNNHDIKQIVWNAVLEEIAAHKDGRLIISKNGNIQIDRSKLQHTETRVKGGDGKVTSHYDRQNVRVTDTGGVKGRVIENVMQRLAKSGIGKDLGKATISAYIDKAASAANMQVGTHLFVKGSGDTFSYETANIGGQRQTNTMVGDKALNGFIAIRFGASVQRFMQYNVLSSKVQASITEILVGLNAKQGNGGSIWTGGSATFNGVMRVLSEVGFNQIVALDKEAVVRLEGTEKFNKISDGQVVQTTKVTSRTQLCESNLSQVEFISNSVKNAAALGADGGTFIVVRSQAKGELIRTQLQKDGRQVNFIDGSSPKAYENNMTALKGQLRDGTHNPSTVHILVDVAEGVNIFAIQQAIKPGTKFNLIVADMLPAGKMAQLQLRLGASGQRASGFVNFILNYKDGTLSAAEVAAISEAPTQTAKVEALRSALNSWNEAIDVGQKMTVIAEKTKMGLDFNFTPTVTAVAPLQGVTQILSTQGWDAMSSGERVGIMQQTMSGYDVAGQTAILNTFNTYTSLEDFNLLAGTYNLMGETGRALSISSVRQAMQLGPNSYLGFINNHSGFDTQLQLSNMMGSEQFTLDHAENLTGLMGFSSDRASQISYMADLVTVTDNGQIATSTEGNIRIDTTQAQGATANQLAGLSTLNSVAHVLGVNQTQIKTYVNNLLAAAVQIGVDNITHSVSAEASRGGQGAFNASEENIAQVNASIAHQDSEAASQIAAQLSSVRGHLESGNLAAMNAANEELDRMSKTVSQANITADTADFANKAIGTLNDAITQIQSLVSAVENMTVQSYGSALTSAQVESGVTIGAGMLTSIRKAVNSNDLKSLTAAMSGARKALASGTKLSAETETQMAMAEKTLQDMANGTTLARKINAVLNTVNSEIRATEEALGTSAKDHDVNRSILSNAARRGDLTTLARTFDSIRSSLGKATLKSEEQKRALQTSLTTAQSMIEGLATITASFMNSVKNMTMEASINTYEQSVTQMAAETQVKQQVQQELKAQMDSLRSALTNSNYAEAVNAMQEIRTVLVDSATGDALNNIEIKLSQQEKAIAASAVHSQQQAEEMTKAVGETVKSLVRQANVSAQTTTAIDQALGTAQSEAMFGNEDGIRTSFSDAQTALQNDLSTREIEMTTKENSAITSAENMLKGIASQSQSTLEEAQKAMKEVSETIDALDVETAMQATRLIQELNSNLANGNMLMARANAEVLNETLSASELNSKAKAKVGRNMNTVIKAVARVQEMMPAATHSQTEAARSKAEIIVEGLREQTDALTKMLPQAEQLRGQIKGTVTSLIKAIGLEGKLTAGEVEALTADIVAGNTGTVKAGVTYVFRQGGKEIFSITGDSQNAGRNLLDVISERTDISEAIKADLQTEAALRFNGVLPYEIGYSRIEGETADTPAEARASTKAVIELNDDGTLMRMGETSIVRKGDIASKVAMYLHTHPQIAESFDEFEGDIMAMVTRAIHTGTYSEGANAEFADVLIAERGANGEVAQVRKLTSRVEDGERRFVLQTLNEAGEVTGEHTFDKETADRIEQAARSAYDEMAKE